MISMIIPPGWTLHAGGAHIALPLLSGYLHEHGIECSLRDLNVEAAALHGATISEAEVASACSGLSVEEMNDLYFGAEDRLGKAAGRFGGTWLAHEGYQHQLCDVGDPESVRLFSLEPSPFTAYFRDRVIPEVLAENPSIVGLSLYVPSQLLTAFEFVRLLRSAGYAGYVALGGNHISRIIADMRLPWVFDLVDGLIAYQGERALLKIHECLRQGRPFDAVPSLTWRKPDGSIVANTVSLLKTPEFAKPRYDGLPHEKYWGTHYLTMIGARGCFYGKCSFCAIPYGWGPKNYIGRSHGDFVVSAMNEAHETFGTTRFKFVDEALHPRMLTEMSAARADYAADFEFEGYVRFDPNWISGKFLQSCHRAGLRKAYMGLELAPSENRDVLSKADKADPLSVLRRMKDHGIKTHIFCLFGFPGTGVDDAVRTIEFVLRHSEYIDTLDIFPFYYARHTSVPGVKVLDEPIRTWRTENKYVPDASGVLWPEEVKILAERGNDIVWKEFPHWSHPIYRMYSPWHESKVPARKLEFA